MTAFNLVVVSPFNDYRRGSVISDPVIVNNILDKNSYMYEFAKYCRRVIAKEVIHQEVNNALNTPEDQNNAQPDAEHPNVLNQEASVENPSIDLLDENKILTISSVKDDDADAGQPAKNQRRKR